MTWDQHSKNHIPLSKKFFPFMIFFQLRIATLILHMAITRLILLVREKESPTLTFTNLYVTLHEIRSSIWLLKFVSLLLVLQAFLFLTGFRF